jgi:type II secretory pathway pseudopilin PulG
MRRLRRFTLLEILLVVSILAILIGLLLPAVFRARKYGDRARCQGNLLQLGKALEMYSQDHYGHYPYNCSSQKASDPGRTQLSEALSPYVKSPKLYECPDDYERLFAKEGSSYIWNYLQLDLPGNGRAGQDRYLASPYGRVAASGFPLLVDASAYHGPSGRRESFNVLFASGSVGTGKDIAF